MNVCSEVNNDQGFVSNLQGHDWCNNAIQHEPPLLYDLENDPSERYPLKASDYSAVLAKIWGTVEEHRKNLDLSVKEQVDTDQNPELVPCCDPKTQCVCNFPKWS